MESNYIINKKMVPSKKHSFAWSSNLLITPFFNKVKKW